MDKKTKNFKKRVMFTCTPYSDKELLRILMQELAQEYLHKRFKDTMKIEIIDFSIKYTFNSHG